MKMFAVSLVAAVAVAVMGRVAGAVPLPANSVWDVANAAAMRSNQVSLVSNASMFQAGEAVPSMQASHFVADHQTNSTLAKMVVEGGTDQLVRDMFFGAHAYASNVSASDETHRMAGP
ncbi:hypothetical protein BJ741DRAFT_630146 [Chytriomyces cf. hyalinus JEL632]|nr:hypothetical protein BJ741DRAFT_630146 [Chytriomyces cf. hyalinus JEL632]